MKNLLIADIFYEIADLLDILGIQWKPNAFRKAARSISSLTEDVEFIYKSKGIDGLKEISGVGEGIAKKIAEFLDDGKVSELEKLKKQIPSGVYELIKIPGLGPKKAYKLFKDLKIKSVDELESAARSNRLMDLEGFGEKSQADIISSIELYKKGQQRFLLWNALVIARDIVNKLKSLKEVKNIEIGGSIKRMQETVKDIDILVVSSNPVKVMNSFASFDNVDKIVVKGNTKSSVVLREGINCDLRVVPEKSFGGAVQYFTGNKDHNVVMRKLAIKKGFKLSEYGLFNSKTNKYVCGRSEKEIYSKLGVPYFPPEMRNNNGEFQLKKVPNLINYSDIKGDLHMHTVWSDGADSTEDMIKKAVEFGYEYIAFTDHSKFQHVANGLDEKRLVKRLEELDELQKKYSEIRIFKGSEVDILSNGKLDYSNNVLKNLDWVVVSVHSGFKMPKDEMTERIVRALSNTFVNVFAHPTGRRINRREPYDFDVDKVFQTAKDNGVFLEINSSPSRLDLNDVLIRKALENKQKLIIDTDSHSIDHLQFMELGIAQARRAWATKDDIINTLPLKKFEKLITK